MQFRKYLKAGKYILQAQGDGNWKTVRAGSALQKQFLAATGQMQIDAGDLKPFAPRSYRDFMLFEAHYINAASNYAKTNRPGAYRIAQIYKKLTGKTHPKLKPAPLWYKEPIYYMGGHMNFFGHGKDIVWPGYSSLMDYELELGFVLAKPLYNASPDEAEAAIGGFVVFNDFSGRDGQMPEMASGFGPQKSKHFANAISSEFVTADEILPRVNNLAGTVSINGEHVSTVSSGGMQYTLGEALAHASTGEHLYPGEFFATGTLPGGCGLETGRMLAKGDEISLSIEGIGALTNKIV